MITKGFYIGAFFLGLYFFWSFFYFSFHILSWSRRGPATQPLHNEGWSPELADRTWLLNQHTCRWHTLDLILLAIFVIDNVGLLYNSNLTIFDIETRGFAPRCVKAESLVPEGSLIGYKTKKKERTKNMNLINMIKFLLPHFFYVVDHCEKKERKT